MNLVSVVIRKSFCWGEEGCWGDFLGSRMPTGSDQEEPSAFFFLPVSPLRPLLEEPYRGQLGKQVT